jgi:phosphatidylserine/phosphatidylglycerophosphate/cardiolipin synthase-like enzyme
MNGRIATIGSSSEAPSETSTVPGAMACSSLKLHAKLVFADNQRAIVGSINLAPGSFDSRRELAIEVDDDSIAKRLHQVVHHDWDNSRSSTSPTTDYWLSLKSPTPLQRRIWRSARTRGRAKEAGDIHFLAALAAIYSPSHRRIQSADRNGQSGA